MKTRVQQLLKTRRYIKAHKSFISVLLLLLGLFTAGNVWFAMVQNSLYNASVEKSASELASMDKLIEDSKEKKAAEILRQKNEQQAADSRKAADDSLINGAQGATIIDSKLCNPLLLHSNPAAIDVVVNKKHCIQPLSYIPELTTVHGATLSTLAIDDFSRLFLAAKAAGQPFYVTSSYRSYAHQVSTYQKWVATSGQKAADTYSARPGYSEHQTGLAFDVAANGCALSCFGSTSQYTWLQENAANYGFIQRYHKGSEVITGYMAEEWHYRYVGVKVAQDMKKRGIKTLEEYWKIQGGDY